MVAIFAEIPWIAPLLGKLPVNDLQKNMMEFGMATTKKRMDRGTAGRPDVFTHLASEDQQEKIAFDNG